MQNKPKIKVDRWFMVLMTALLLALSNILFAKYAVNIPQNLTNIRFWLSFLTVIFAVYCWIWLFKIYIQSVRDKKDGEK